MVYTRHCYIPEKNPIEAKLFPELKKTGLRKGTHGWNIHQEIAPAKDDITVDKTRYDAFFKTKLNQVLKKHTIKTIIITGTMTEVCCESTARSAMFFDYDVIFCSDFTCSRPLRKPVASAAG